MFVSRTCACAQGANRIYRANLGELCVCIGEIGVDANRGETQRLIGIEIEIEIQIEIKLELELEMQNY